MKSMLNRSTGRKILCLFFSLCMIIGIFMMNGSIYATNTNNTETAEPPAIVNEGIDKDRTFTLVLDDTIIDVVLPAIWYPIDKNTNKVIPGLNPKPTYPDMYPRPEVAKKNADGVYEIDLMGVPKPKNPGEWSDNNFMYVSNLWFTNRFHRIVAQAYGTYELDIKDDNGNHVFNLEVPFEESSMDRMMLLLHTIWITVNIKGYMERGERLIKKVRRCTCTLPQRWTRAYLNRYSRPARLSLTDLCQTTTFARLSSTM